LAAHEKLKGKIASPQLTKKETEEITNPKKESSPANPKKSVEIPPKINEQKMQHSKRRQFKKDSKKSIFSDIRLVDNLRDLASQIITVIEPKKYMIDRTIKVSDSSNAKTLVFGLKTKTFSAVRNLGTQLMNIAKKSLNSSFL
jgi:hypothetical protein